MPDSKVRNVTMYMNGFMKSEYASIGANTSLSFSLLKAF
jgi:hypothetical protein